MIKANYLVATIIAAGLMTACGAGDDGSTATTAVPSSTSARAPLAIRPTSATTPATLSLPPLTADQPYIDNAAYDTTAGGSLPSATEGAAVTHHRITLNGQTLTYTATAGHLTVRDASTNAPTASIFYTAYTLDGADVTQRPITFFFNGGPGASSNYLRMGSYGPLRVFSEQGSTVTGPNDVTLGENPQTLIDKTDMVFVDPPGTGYSEAIAPKKNQDFWGVDADETVNAGLIYRYLNVNNRGQSPLMIYGESYGGPRVGIMSYTLHNTYGIKLSGLLMQAPALNFYEKSTYNLYPDGSIKPARRYPLPAFLLPTVTMTAKYWGAITDPALINLDSSQLFQKSEDFAFNELVKLTPSVNLINKQIDAFTRQYPQVWEATTRSSDPPSIARLNQMGTLIQSMENSLSSGVPVEFSSNYVASIIPAMAESFFNSPTAQSGGALNFTLGVDLSRYKADYISWISSPRVKDEAKKCTTTLNALMGNGVYASANKSLYLFNSSSTGSAEDPSALEQTIKFANDSGAQIAADNLQLMLNSEIATTNAMVNGKTLGLYDLRKGLTGGDISQSMNNYLTWDPALDDLSAYTPIFASYVYNNLKYQAVSGYQGLNSLIARTWNRVTSYPDGSQLPFPDATIFIADEMAINPKMQVLTAAGYYDGVVPAAKVDWDIQYVSDPTGGRVPQWQMQSSYTRILYPGGHMAYADDVSRQQMHDSLVSFYAKATTTSIPSMTR
ncbi:S10 family serine carboxypeptidase-like protein [Paraburkholderia nodosa]|uniref:S10 family serine carboxypeptidase-like protein n=1 Tax=Paraburkholderia nodosa TaxID=392320 RepID=UPI0013769393|nr:hypothetical protein [Paraburkholderia nodosa]